MRKYVVICSTEEQCMKFLLATYPNRVVTTFKKDWFKCGIIQSVDDNVSWKIEDVILTVYGDTTHSDGVYIKF